MEQNIDKSFIITQKLKRPKSSKGLSKIEALYEEVIQKNFQTIDELLKRLSQVVIRHDEFETEFQLLIKRLSKLENDLETIHNEHRRDNLHIASNINGIRTQIVGIDTQFKMLFQRVQHRGFTGLFQNKLALNRKQSLENGSLISSTHKLSQHSLLFNLDPTDEELQLLKRLESQAPFSNIESSKNQIYPLMKNSYKKLRSPKQSRNENDQKQTKNLLNLPLRTPTEIRVRLQKQPISPNNLNTTVKNSVFLAQKNEEEKILHYLEILTELLTQSKQIEQDAKVQIVASFARNREKIASLFQETNKKNMDTNQAKANFYKAIRQIFSEDEILNSKFSSGLHPNEISEQISEILFENLSQKLTAQEQTRLLVKRAVDKETFSLNAQILELKKKDQKLIDLEEQFKIKMKDLNDELKIIKQKSVKWITQDQLFGEMLRVVQNSHKRWEQSHLNFANKQETIKAISFLSSKINDFIGVTENKNPNQECSNQENYIETKCLCCSSSLNKSRTTRKTTPTGRGTILNGQVIRILKPNQLKKKALELLRNNNVAKAKSFCEY